MAANQQAKPFPRAAVGVHEMALQLVRERATSGARVIDMGTGQGALALELTKEGFSVTAVDVDPDDFRLSGQVEYVVCDFNDVEQIRGLSAERETTYDVALGIEVIEHVENPWEYVRNLKKLVRPGGYVLISTPNPAAWHSRLTFLRRGEFDDFGSRGQLGHINPIAPWEMNRILREVGLETVAVHEVGDVYENPSLSQKSIRKLARLLRFGQKGSLDGFCQMLLTRRTS